MTPERPAPDEHDAAAPDSKPENISQATEEVLHHIFEDLDTNHDGRLEPEEIKVPSSRLILQVFADTCMHCGGPIQHRPGHGSVTTCACMCTPQAGLRRLGLPARSQDYLRELLQQYDRNGDGHIDWAEYHAYVARKERVVQRTFQKLDADGSGEISADELVCAPCSCPRTPFRVVTLCRVFLWSRHAPQPSGYARGVCRSACRPRRPRRCAACG